MFDRSDLEQFDDATPPGETRQNVLPPLRRRKPLVKQLRFWLLNVALGFPSFLIILAIAAEGARSLLDIAQMKLFRLPLPGVAMMAAYEGFRDLDLAHLISGVLCIAVTFVWVRVIQEARGQGTVMNKNGEAKFVLYLYAGIAIVLILADGFLFYMGVAARGGGWGEMPAYIPAVCTLLYTASVAAFAAFHADYINSDTV